MLNVILRTCTRVDELNSHLAGNKKEKRPFADSKRELVLVCLNSLLHSLDTAGVVHVLDDNSSRSDQGDIQRLLESYGSAHRFTALEKTGNGHSLEAALHYARKEKFPLVYFCEDDYLHLPHAISSMLDCFKRYKAIVHPIDYYDRYIGRDERDVYSSYIYLGAYNYWRTIRHTTFTFMVERRILEKYWDIYIKLAEINKDVVGAGGEDETINKIYKHEPCLSPLPSLTAHVSLNPPLPPYVDWQAVFERNKTDFLERIK